MFQCPDRAVSLFYCRFFGTWRYSWSGFQCPDRAVSLFYLECFCKHSLYLFVSMPWSGGIPFLLLLNLLTEEETAQVSMPWSGGIPFLLVSSVVMAGITKLFQCPDRAVSLFYGRHRNWGAVQGKGFNALIGRYPFSTYLIVERYYLESNVSMPWSGGIPFLRAAEAEEAVKECIVSMPWSGGIPFLPSHDTILSTVYDKVSMPWSGGIPFLHHNWKIMICIGRWWFQCPDRAVSLFYAYHITGGIKMNVLFQCPDRAVSLFYWRKPGTWGNSGIVSMPWSGGIPFLQYYCL